MTDAQHKAIEDAYESLTEHFESVVILTNETDIAEGIDDFRVSH
jgi:hypothetical protein